MITEVVLLEFIFWEILCHTVYPTESLGFYLGRDRKPALVPFIIFKHSNEFFIFLKNLRFSNGIENVFERFIFFRISLFLFNVVEHLIDFIGLLNDETAGAADEPKFKLLSFE